MSEEVRKAKHAVPRAIFWTIAINAVMGYAMVVVILFTMGSLDDVLNSTYPVMAVLVNATGSIPSSTAMSCGLLIISLSVNLASIASVSRLTWAWARDGGLPQYFAYVCITDSLFITPFLIFLQVSPRYRVPVRALWLPVFITMILACLNIASTAAFGAFIALSSMGLFASYMIAIGCMLYTRLTTGVRLGGWNLGRWGVLINIYALLYSAYIFIFLPFPASLPVTGLNMNYALPIFTFTVIFSLGSWWVYGRKRWEGLNKEIVEIVLAESESNYKD